MLDVLQTNTPGLSLLLVFILFLVLLIIVLRNTKARDTLTFLFSSLHILSFMFFIFFYIFLILAGLGDTTRRAFLVDLGRLARSPEFIELVRTLIYPFILAIAVAFFLLMMWLLRERLREMVVVLGFKEFEAFGFQARLHIEKSIKQRRFLKGAGITPPLQLALEQLPQFVKGKSILWIDDNPFNNVVERLALEELEVFVVTSEDITKGMIEMLKEGHYQLVISDWNTIRGEDGYLRLRQMREQNIETPVVFYTGVEDYERRRKVAVDNGAVGLTYQPDELFRWIFMILTAEHLDREVSRRSIRARKIRRRM